MDVRDGFILGIYNYCDRWCETCAFTSRCRVFADRAEMDAAMDPYLKAVAEAPPLPEEEPPPPPRWMQEMIAEMNAAAREPLSPEEVRGCSRRCGRNTRRSNGAPAATACAPPNGSRRKAWTTCATRPTRAA